MKLLLLTAFFGAVITVALSNEVHAATVSCEVKEVSDSTLVLENCDERMLKEFKKGDKVKVKVQKKDN